MQLKPRGVLLSGWTEQPRKVKGKAVYIAAIAFIVLVAYFVYTNPEVKELLGSIAQAEQRPSKASKVGASAASFPSSIKVDQNATISLSFENSDQIKHKISLYIVPAISGRLKLYLGNDLLEGNGTCWWYSKLLDPGELSTVPVIVRGVLEAGEKSISFDISLIYAVDGAFSQESVKNYTVTITK